VGGEFILHSDYEAFKFIQEQYDLKPRHAKWVEYIKAIHFVIHYKSRLLNKETDALSRRYLLLLSPDLRVLRFEMIKELQPKDEDFKETFEACSRHPHIPFHIEEGFLFK